MNETEPAFVAGLSEIAAAYDAILCDVWGVIHNGIVRFADAEDALVRFRQAGGCVVLLTNAPRPGDAVVGQLDRLGFSRQAYDAVVSSGDLTRATVIERRGEPGEDRLVPRWPQMEDGLDVAFAGPDEAAYVVCSGLFDDDRDTLDDYRDMLARMRSRRLPMICANPDLVVERGERLVLCAGSIAQAYEEAGGDVLYAGKPHVPVYDLALATARRLAGSEVPKERVLAVGDAIRTDIAGAVAAGIPSLFVARGIHGAELGLHDGALDPQRARAWLMGQAARPDLFSARLAWS